MDFINKYIAPWVLPNEVIPMHCVWVPEKNLNKIVVLIPEGYELVEPLNFTEYNFEKSSNSIIVRLNDLKSKNYFGIGDFLKEFFIEIRIPNHFSLVNNSRGKYSVEHFSQIFKIKPGDDFPIELDPVERKKLKEMLNDKTKKEIVYRMSSKSNLKSAWSKS